MIQLPNGCYCSELKVNPTNWKTLRATTSKDWYIQYRFYDPTILKNGKIAPKLKIIKGMNSSKTREDRRSDTQILIDNELSLLLSGYNPITGIIASEEEINPRIYLLEAMAKALDKLTLEPKTRQGIVGMFRHFETGAKKLRYDMVQIGEIKRKHIRAIFDYLGGKNNWSNNTFNNYRKYMSIIFKELVELEAMEFNPIIGIAKKEVLKKIRTTLTEKERKMVTDHVESKYPTFWNFLQIFFHSGARISELLLIKKEDVDLKNQRFKIVVKKGRSRKEVMKVIKDVALPFWTNSVQNSKDGDYIFSYDLKPGALPITPIQITKRWYRLVKKPLGITADFYSLKHLNLDETAAILDLQAAASMAGHTTTVVTMAHYAVGEKERIHQRLRAVGNKF